MEPEGTLSCSQKPNAGPYPEPMESRPQPYSLKKGKFVPVLN